MLTDEIINKLVELFDEDQKKALEFQQGNRHMTLQKQLKYYFGDQIPLTKDENRFLDGFALNIQKNIGIICKISRLKEYSESLSNKKGFTKTTLGLSDSQSKSERKTLNNIEGVKEYLKHGGNYSGNTERSDDWSGIKEIMDLQVQKSLKTDVQVLFKTAVEDVPGEGNLKIKVSETSVNPHLLTSDTDAEIDKNIALKSANVREWPSWNNVSTAGDFAKARNSERSSREGTDFNNANSNILNSSFNFSDSDNISKTLEADIHDLRSTFWNSFYYLFLSWPCL